MTDEQLQAAFDKAIGEFGRCPRAGEGGEWENPWDASAWLAEASEIFGQMPEELKQRNRWTLERAESSW